MRNTNTATVNEPGEGVARRLMAVRQQSGLNQSAFAARLGFARRTYLGWERGESDPPIWLLDALHREFGIDPNWLLHGPGDRPRQYGAGLDWDRFSRLLTAVDQEARAAGLAPRPEQICELTRAIFEGAPAEEDREIERLALTFKTMKTRGYR